MEVRAEVGVNQKRPPAKTALRPSMLVFLYLSCAATSQHMTPPSPPSVDTPLTKSYMIMPGDTAGWCKSVYHAQAPVQLLIEFPLRGVALPPPGWSAPSAFHDICAPDGPSGLHITSSLDTDPKMKTWRT